MEDSSNQDQNPPEKDQPVKTRGMPLHSKILLGLILGGSSGVFANYFFSNDPRLLAIVDNFTEPAGKVFLRLMFMIVIPLIFTSLSLGVAEIKDIRKLGNLGLKSFLLLMQNGSSKEPKIFNGTGDIHVSSEMNGLTLIPAFRLGKEF